MITYKFVVNIIGVYQTAWEQKDPDLILTIFHKNASYHERVFDEPYVGHIGIREYWKSKVVDGQDQIVFRLENIFIDGQTAIVEWTCSFFDMVLLQRKEIKEVAILTFEARKIVSLREYWSSMVLE